MLKQEKLEAVLGLADMAPQPNGVDTQRNK